MKKSIKYFIFFWFSIALFIVMCYNIDITRMKAIIYQHDKRSGITYAYVSISYWDKENE